MVTFAGTIAVLLILEPTLSMSSLTTVEVRPATLRDAAKIAELYAATAKAVSYTHLTLPTNREV